MDEMNRRRLFTGAFVSVLAATIAAYALWPRSALDGLTFVTLQGDTIRLRDLRGNIVLVNFWATTCPACAKEMPELAQMYERYRARGFEVVAVAMAYDPPASVAEFAAKHALPFPVVLDPRENIAAALGGVKVVPTTYVIDKNGQIQSRTLGMIAFDKLSTYLERAVE